MRIRIKFQQLLDGLVLLLLNTINKFLYRRNLKLNVEYRDKPSFSSSPKKWNASWSIVWHGKILNDKHYEWFVKRLEVALKLYHHVPIVISTYPDNYGIRLKSYALKQRVSVIFCEDVGSLPSPFPFSICQQIETFYRGLQAAKKLGCDFVVKLRIDQFFSFDGFPDTFDFFLKHYSNSFGFRIFTTSFNTYKVRACSPSDMFMFGSVEKLETYWHPCSNSEYLEIHETLNSISSDPLYSAFLVPEVFLASRYLMSIGRFNKIAQTSHVELFGNHIGVVDSSEMNFEWFKLPYPIGNNIYSLSPLVNRLTERSVELTHFAWICDFLSDTPDIRLNSEPI